MNTGHRSGPRRETDLCPSDLCLQSDSIRYPDAQRARLMTRTKSSVLILDRAKKPRLRSQTSRNRYKCGICLSLKSGVDKVVVLGLSGPVPPCDVNRTALVARTERLLQHIFKLDSLIVRKESLGKFSLIRFHEKRHREAMPF